MSGPRRFERQSESVDLEKIDAIHAKLSTLRIVLGPDPDAAEVREVFAEIRNKDNTTVRIMSVLHRRLTLLKADFGRIKRLVEAEGCTVLDNEDGLLGATNVQQKQARMKVVISDLLDAKAEIETDVSVLEEAFSHARLVRDALKMAFEQASRSLASLEQEYRVSRSAP